MKSLPESWTTCTLKELLIALESGSRPKGGVQGVKEGIPSLGGEHLTFEGGFTFHSIKFVPEEFANRMSKGHIQKNDILIVKDGATTGKTAFVDDDFPYEKAVVNEHIFICRITKHISPKFIFRYLMSKEGRKSILVNFQGSAQGGINSSFVSNVNIPLAPINEQQRIIAKLEKLLARINNCKQRLDKIPGLIKRFRQSVLAAACTGRLTADWRENNPDVEPADVLVKRAHNEIRKQYEADSKKAGTESKKLSIMPTCLERHVVLEPEWVKDLPNTWAVVAFGQVIDKGPQNGIYKPQSDYGEGTMIVRIDNFYNGAIVSWEELKKLRISRNEMERYCLHNQDILINRVNSMKYLGKSALIQGLNVPCVFESNMMRLRVLPQCAHPKYVVTYLQSFYGLRELRKNAKHAVNQSSINQEDVKSSVLPLPPLLEQQEIVRRVDALFKIADQIEARYQRARAYVDKLTQSILAKAFRGELVPQDPADEPASILLERIREERARRELESLQKRNSSRRISPARRRKKANKV
ncbi:MAG: restriction endonuclease subunit S [Armatimonadetes bacterium]|nr:restriction endonuclease subunit S [Armatimonadota bacterium]